MEKGTMIDGVLFSDEEVKTLQDLYTMWKQYRVNVALLFYGRRKNKGGSMRECTIAFYRYAVKCYKSLKAAGKEEFGISAMRLAEKDCGY